MIFEHAAINVADPVAMTDWYVAHLGLIVRKSVDTPNPTRWLADASGILCIEIYRNTSAPILPFAEQPALTFHFAFATADASADEARLIAAGATLLTHDVLPDGSVLVMLRDPFGVCVQLCQRATLLADLDR